MFTGMNLFLILLALLILLLVLAVLVIFWAFKKRMEMDTMNQALRKFFRDGH